MLKAEHILQGRYQLKQQLGNNPSRQTWLAEDLSAQPPELVVVKFLAFSPQTQWDELKLFEREAQVLKHLNHPQIPKYRDYFALDKETSGGLPWFGLVQEYIEGDSLKQRLDIGKEFTEVEVRLFATQVLNILIYLHQLSPPIIHRDLKPSNLILGKNNQIYLVDFGAVQDRAKAEGVTFTVVGTGGYAPPEQLWGRAVPASDLYGLGATLIHLLTGIAPGNLPQHRMRLQFKDKVSLNPSFAQWLEKLINPDLERRFAQASQALSALQAIDINRKGRREKNRDRQIVSLALVQYAAIFLSAIALPAFAIYRYINEGKLTVKEMNRAQARYCLENNNFTDSIDKFDLRIKNPTKNYEYSIRVTESSLGKSAFNYAIPRNDKLKAYVGAAFLPMNPHGVSWRGIGDEWPGTTIACEANSPGGSRPQDPILEEGYDKNGYFFVTKCGSGTTEVKE